MHVMARPAIGIDLFRLDEAAARRWLSSSGQTPWRSETFTPREPGGAIEAIELVDAAQQRSILTGPAKVRLIYATDEDGGTCHLLAELPSKDGEQVRLASPAWHWRSIPAPTSCGVTAAISILTRVADEANAMLQQLQRFVRSQQDESRDVARPAAKAKAPRPIPADVDVAREQLVVGAIVERYTELLRGSTCGPGCKVSTKVPCCDRRARLEYWGSTDPILCTHCAITYTHDLVADSDGGYWAVLTVERTDFITTRR